MRPAWTDQPKTFAEAVEYATQVHATQGRKRNPGDAHEEIPYVSHLLAVAGIVIEDDGGLDDAIAGLLHDVIEDQDTPDHIRAPEIKHLFGADVLAIVEACTGPKKEDPGMGEFRVRKQVYLDKLQEERNQSAIMVSLADKVHNARCTVNDLESEGSQMWTRFNSGSEDQLWWYGSLVEIFDTHERAGLANTARTAELGRLVISMRKLTAT